MSEPPRTYLVDSSIWIPVLRQGDDPARLRDRARELIRAGTASTTGIVRFELLRGARTDQQSIQLAEMLDGLRQLPTDEDAWDDAARIGRQLRAAGLAVPTTDLVIATVAIRSGAILVHRDGDFETIARYAPLQTESHL